MAIAAEQSGACALNPSAHQTLLMTTLKNAPAPSSYATVAIFVLCLLALAGHARAAYSVSASGSEVLVSEQSTSREIDRIRKLTPSKSAVLNQEALAEAREAAERYARIPEELMALEKISVDSIRSRTAEAMNKLPDLIKDCRETDIAENILIIRRQLLQFDNTIAFDIFSAPQEDQSLNENEATTIADIVHFLALSPEVICEKYSDKNAFETMRNQLKSTINIASKKLAEEISAINERAPRAKALSEAWSQYRDLLMKSIEEQSAPATKVADQLGFIIGVFCAFGILMFLAVRIFPSEIQVELIASGQVIQFATVMVILIVICVLGMSKLLTENTLGTLLGGIGGYVLSQGVGRAVSRAAVRDHAAHNTKP